MRKARINQFNICDLRSWRWSVEQTEIQNIEYVTILTYLNHWNEFATFFKSMAVWIRQTSGDVFFHFLSKDSLQIKLRNIREYLKLKGLFWADHSLKYTALYNDSLVEFFAKGSSLFYLQIVFCNHGAAEMFINVVSNPSFFFSNLKFQVLNFWIKKIARRQVMKSASSFNKKYIGKNSNMVHCYILFANKIFWNFKYF